MSGEPLRAWHLEVENYWWWFPVVKGKPLKYEKISRMVMHTIFLVQNLKHLTLSNDIHEKRERKKQRKRAQKKDKCWKKGELKKQGVNWRHLLKCAEFSRKGRIRQIMMRCLSSTFGCNFAKKASISLSIEEVVAKHKFYFFFKPKQKAIVRISSNKGRWVGELRDIQGWIYSSRMFKFLSLL